MLSFGTGIVKILLRIQSRNRPLIQPPSLILNSFTAFGLTSVLNPPNMSGGKYFYLLGIV